MPTTRQAKHEEGEVEKRDYGKEFEEEVKSFLEEKLHLSDVKGGPDFHIAAEGEANQIDACGRYKDILFIFECKAAGRRTKKSLRQDILATRERARIAWDNYRNITAYSHCQGIKFIFITKKIEISEADRNLFKDGTRPSLWYADEKMLEYYSDLVEKLGVYAVYNFLADYGIQPPVEEQLKIMAVKTNLGRYPVYSFFAEPRELLKFAYVARRRSLKEDFYQRMIDKSRINKIQHFLDKGGVFPTNIILSFRTGEKEFDPIKGVPMGKDSEIGVLTIKNSYSAAWIVDGQHRLYSFAKSKSNALIPCIAFDYMNIEDERRFFLEINREQKPIQPDLIWDLEGLANPDTPRGIISNVVRTLNNHEPFLDKIYIPAKGSKAGKLVNMAAFCNGIANAAITKQITPNCIGIENPLFSKTTSTVTYRCARALATFFDLLGKEISGDHRDFIFGNAGVPIILYIFEPIIAYIGVLPSGGKLEPYARAIGDFFDLSYSTPDMLRRLREEVNSEGARKSLAKQIGLHIRRAMKDKNFWPKMEQDETVSEIIEMERRIGSLIAQELSQITTSWERQRVPQAIYQINKTRMEADGSRFEDNLTLGEEVQIILREDNWREAFESVFSRKGSFRNQEELKTAFSYLSAVRNPVLHGKPVIPGKEDLDLCNIYLQKFARVAPETVIEHPEEVPRGGNV